MLWTAPPTGIAMCQKGRCLWNRKREPSMGEISTIGLDIAKNVFQVHGVDEEGQVIVRRQLRRGQVLKYFAKFPPCLIGMEACATAHHWA